MPPENLEEFKQMVEKYDKFKFDTWKRFLGYTPKDLRLTYDDRFILTGTLAGVVEPALGFGITGALLSGKISALAAVDKEKGLAEFERFTAGIPAVIAKKKQPGYIGKPPKIGEVWFRFPEGEEKKKAFFKISDKVVKTTNITQSTVIGTTGWYSTVIAAAVFLF